MLSEDSEDLAVVEIGATADRLARALVEPIDPNIAIMGAVELQVRLLKVSSGMTVIEAATHLIGALKALRRAEQREVKRRLEEAKRNAH